jgi:N-acetylneuraminic acid mutarotase
MRKHSLQSGFLLVLLFGFAILSLSAAGQTSAANQWTWMGGSNTVPWPARGQAGVYGTLGTPAAGNIPGSRGGATRWTDASGNLWLFGGGGSDAAGHTGYLNDLWELNPSTNEWTWMGGSSTVGSNGSDFPSLPGVYGTLGTPAAGNIPGGRSDAAGWTDGKGHLWLFGGLSTLPDGVEVWFNDLWEFNPSNNEWAWMGGSNTPSASGGGLPGVYGALGTPAAGNNPGSRMEAVTWTDNSGNLWLFGGVGYDSHTTPYVLNTWLNDLWEFNPSTSEWAWEGGSSTVPCNMPDGCVQSGTYGTLGTPASGNIPGGRSSAVSWTESKGNFWLFGGTGIDSNYNIGELNDLWEFNPATNEWAWISGSSAVPGTQSYSGDSGVYGTLGTPAATNVPGGRDGGVSWTDKSGNLWLFGGGGYDANGNDNTLNDLWEFNPSTSEWTWMGGSSTFDTDSYGVYGSLGVPAVANIPVSRSAAVSWSDSTGNFWLFGGEGPFYVPASGAYFAVSFNDLWRYQPSASSSFTNAPAPTFSVAGGTYTSTQTVTISDSVPGAAIYYTTDGSIPTLNSTTYASPITVSLYSTTETIHAMAVASGYFNSAVASATYVIDLPASSATVTTIASSPNPSRVGEYVTFTATVLPVSAGATPAGTVQFIVGSSPLGPPVSPLGPPVPLNGSGVATYTTAALYAGVASITAAYTPSSGSPFTASTSTPLLQSVAGQCPGTSSTTLTSSQNPSSVGQAVVFSASVSVGAFPQCVFGGGPTTGGTFAPTGLQGSVQFAVNGAPVGSPVPLIGNSGSGGATWSTSTLPPGADSITAAFIESNGYVGSSTSNAVSQVVTGTAPTQTAATPTFSVPGGTYATMQAVTISDATAGAIIYYTTDGITTPTINSTQYTGPIIVMASETIQAIAVAANDLNSAVASATYTIPADFTVAINPASISVQAGQSGTATITVRDEGGFNSNVSFACSGLPAGAACGFVMETVPTPLGVTYTTLTVTTSATAAALHRNGWPLLPGSALAVALCCFGWKRRRRWQMLMLLAVSMAGLSLLNGCGAASPIVIDPPPVTSTVTVTATAGSAQHTATFSLTVN